MTGPDAHAFAAPTWNVLEATPETSSALVPDTLTVPVTTPPGAVGATATVPVGSSVSMKTVRPGPSALPPSSLVVLMWKQ